MPSGGDGWYYFYIYLRVDAQEFGLFDIEGNGVHQCTAAAEMIDSVFNTQQATCGVVTSLTAGTHNNRPHPKDGEG